MRSNLVKFWERLRASYWFFPTVMALGAIALSFVLVTLDTRFGASWLFDRVDWLDANQPDGARALLSTIAGSMITVAGVTFSITIAAVASASAQFGPRILTNLMEDRSNQITLGTFIATAFARRQIPGAYRYDDEDTLRVIAFPITFDDYAAAFFDRILPYASADANAARYLIQTMCLLMVQLKHDRHRATIEQRADVLMAACRQALPLPASVEAVELFHQAVRRLAQQDANSQIAAEAYTWLSGQA